MERQQQKTCLLSREEIAAQVTRLGQEISQDYAGQSVLLVGVLKGSFIFLADLVRAITIPVEIDFVRISSYGSQTTSQGKVTLTKDLETNCQGRHILLVEDIVDTGISCDWLRTHFVEKEGVASVKLCTLIDKGERRQSPCQIDYRGFCLNAGFIVGYGLDCNEQDRHLPAIYTIDPDIS